MSIQYFAEANQVSLSLQCFCFKIAKSVAAFLRYYKIVYKTTLLKYNKHESYPITWM